MNKLQVAYAARKASRKRLPMVASNAPAAEPVEANKEVLQQVMAKVRKQQIGK